MNTIFFEKTFKNHPTAVLVCRDQEGYPITYANMEMKLLANPLITTEQLRGGIALESIDMLLKFTSDEIRTTFFALLRDLGTISNFETFIFNHESQQVAVRISGNFIELDDETYLILYVNELAASPSVSDGDNGVVSTAFYLANQSQSAEEAINQILGYIGAYTGVSRVYIFEEESSTLTRNTYEWCAEHTAPAIQDLQHLKKEDYNYDAIVNGGMYIANDIRELPENDFLILDAQGIKSLAILPLFFADQPLGYIGFDDCNDYRVWTSSDIRVLRDISSIIISLLIRRNSEVRVTRLLHVLQATSDNIDNIVFVADIETDEVLFANKALGNSLCVDPHSLIGQPCWKMLRPNENSRCENCPLHKMIAEDGSIINKSVIWENHNVMDNKWYLVRDAIIEWIDGRKVHMETATEITHQKAYEAELMHSASMDSMTGTYNREWGYKIMQEIRADTQEGRDVSLVFIDLDGLKQVNDHYGHEIGDDKILKSVETIRSRVRQRDVIIRWGGDEFLLILDCNVSTATQIMQDIDSLLAKAEAEQALPYNLGISYGITKLNDESFSTLDSIISQADSLMYKFKTKKTTITN